VVVVKVCFLCSNHLPEARGGTEQVTAALEREFRARGVEVVVITGSDVPHAGTDRIVQEHEGTRVHRLFKLADEWDHQGFVRPRILAIVRDLFGRELPDLVHVHSTAALGTGCSAIAQEIGIPVVMTFHDLWATCARYFRLPQAGVTCPTGTDRTACVRCVDAELRVGAARVRIALAERDRRVAQDLACVAVATAPSSATARTVRECAPFPRAIEVVPHGLLRVPPPELRSSGRRPGRPVRIGTFGGLGPEKGVVELAGALHGLCCELHLAGRHYNAVVSAAVARLAGSGVAVTGGGEYGPADPHPAARLDLAVFPSRCQETYGLVVDEALAHGVPCVVSDQGAFAERSGQPGVVVTPLAKLAPTLHDLVTRPERIDALRAAIPAELPTIGKAAARYLELYRSLS
jgi:glycosyltransferase involved in cell wall biosynthesis